MANTLSLRRLWLMYKRLAVTHRPDRTKRGPLAAARHHALNFRKPAVQACGLEKLAAAGP